MPPESGISIFTPGKTWETNKSTPQEAKYSFKAEGKSNHYVVLSADLQTLVCVQMMAQNTAEMIFNSYLLEAWAKFPADVSHCDAREMNGLSHSHCVVQVA